MIYQVKTLKMCCFFLITYIHLLVYAMPLSTFHCGAGEEGEDCHLTLDSFTLVEL